jgi:hypothetical protein
MTSLLMTSLLVTSLLMTSLLVTSLLVTSLLVSSWQGSSCQVSSLLISRFEFWWKSLINDLRSTRYIAGRYYLKLHDEKISYYMMKRYRITWWKDIILHDKKIWWRKFICFSQNDSSLDIVCKLFIFMFWLNDIFMTSNHNLVW